MIEEIRLPEISENVETGEVTKVLVKVGDTVEVDQPLMELETEKAVFELPSTVAGKVTEVLVKEGDTVKVGQTLVKVEAEAGAAKSQAPQQTATRVEAEEKQAEAPTAKQPEQKPEGYIHQNQA